MASTRPENENVEEADAQAVVAVEALAFPSGAKALFKKGPGGRFYPMDDDDRVFLINVSLQRVSFRVRDESIKASKEGFREKEVTILPGGSLEVRVADARRALEALEHRTGGDRQIVVAPPKGDCENKISFSHPAPAPGERPPPGARQFQSCPYSGCPHHPQPVGANGVMVQWSIWQSQTRIAKLGTEPAIRRWIESFDPRPEVVAWALYTMQRREQSRRESMMLGSPGRTDDRVY